MTSGDIKPISCPEARDQFALMLYGELSFDEEERVESHLDECAECRSALAQQKNLHEAIDAVQLRPSPALLAQSRTDLSSQLDAEQQKASGWWSQLGSTLTTPFKVRWLHPVLQPVGAIALLAMGFFGARVMPDNFWGQQASISGLGGARVRNVVQQDGHVQIVVDEPRERTISGSLDDQNIRELLMAAVRDAPDAGLRAQTVTILVSGAEDADVRRALTFALSNDQSDNVRGKAMEGLKAYTRDPAVQNALAQVLLNDGNPDMRTQAIGLLTSGNTAELDQQLIGALQEFMSREGDTHVREMGRKILESRKASPDIY